MEKSLLMIPGPIEIDPSVLSEMSAPMEAHYGVKWTRYYDETRNMIKEVLGTKSDLFLFVGSGHAALDAAIGNLVDEDEEVLVLSNGFFGERAAEIVESYRGKAVQLKTDWGKAFDPDEVDEYLKKNHERFKKVLIVHNETSTGVTNPVRELAQVIKKYDLIVFADCVCSIGVTEFKMDDWGIDICITASQKGLGAPPGLAIICVNDRAWAAIENRKKKPVGWYLNLLTMRDFAVKQKEWQPYGITMAVNNVKALNRALKNIKAEGLTERIKKHEKMAKFFRESIRGIGLEIVAAEEVACNAVSVVKNPSGYNSEELIKLLDEEYQISVANGLGPFANKVIRVGHMNLGASRNSIIPVISALEEIIS